MGEEESSHVRGEDRGIGAFEREMRWEKEKGGNRSFKSRQSVQVLGDLCDSPKLHREGERGGSGHTREGVYECASLSGWTEKYVKAINE
jgi:hypothetical protein